jgi:hypothetical protein
MGDVSLNQRLFVGGDVSLNQRLFVGGDVSLNQRLFVGGDVSLNQRLFVMGDVSLNQRLFVMGDVSLNQRLFVGGDVSLNQRLFLKGDASFNQRLFVNGDVSLNQRLFVMGDASFNRNVAILGNLNLTRVLERINTPKVYSSSISIDFLNNNAVYIITGVTGNFTCAFTNVPAVSLTSFITTLIIIPSVVGTYGYCNAVSGTGGTPTLWFSGGNVSISINNSNLVVQSISVINSEGTYYAISNVTGYQA